jgi:Protein of unknown function (DUF4058)
MPSVFPGMDPYLENPELWSAVHNRLIVAIADALVEHLSEKYRVEIEKRTYWSLTVHERYLEIREVATGRVVTVIELLSPKNKRTGEGRTAYENKRNQILASLTNFVEIDLLRGGKPFPIAATNLGDYRILICRGDRRPRGDLYAFKLRQPIPSVSIPLMPDEIAPILDLQKLLNQVYDRGRYHLAIDYTQSPTPALSTQDRQWLDQQLQAAS